MSKKNLKYYKHRYTVFKELNTLHESLYKTASQELKFERLNKAHLHSILDEVKILLEKWCKTNLIEAVIELWKQREMLDLSIHYELECGWIKRFNNKN